MDDLEPHARALVEMMRVNGSRPIESLPLEQGRVAYRDSRAALQHPPPQLERVRNLSCPGVAGPIRLRLYEPAAPGKEGMPALIFFHGGGWVLGDLDSHDVPCRQIALESGCTVVAVDYRLAPEAKFPAAVEDAVAAADWVVHQGRAIGIDPDRVAIGGDSAGANLATVACLHAREARFPDFRLQVLIYPVTDLTGARPSRTLFAEGRMLTASAMDWFTAQYVRDDSDRRDPRASPLFAADLARLPPALVLTAGADLLRDEGEAYADRLAESGVPVTRHRYPGQVHGFLTMGRVLPDAADAVRRVAEALRHAL